LHQLRALWKQQDVALRPKMSEQLICEWLADAMRMEEDCAKDLENIVATGSSAGWVIVLDNLNPHMSATFVILLIISFLGTIFENAIENSGVSYPIQINPHWATLGSTKSIL
jgi:hypothetical protein